jgi:hypothetical protein
MSSNFPIVVVTGESAQIVYGEGLERFKQEHPDYSFLVPAETYEFFRKQIRSNTRARSSADSQMWDASFTREELDSTRQKFVVYATWDDDRENVGEYEATDKELFPKFHKVYFGPGKVFVTLPTAIGVTIGFWSVLGTAIWYWRRRTKPLK